MTLREATTSDPSLPSRTTAADRTAVESWGADDARTIGSAALASVGLLSLKDDQLRAPRGGSGSAGQRTTSRVPF